MKFIKKPVVVEAFPASDAIRIRTEGLSGLPAWLIAAYGRGDVAFCSGGISLRTLEGMLVARPGDWIICGIKGEVYPCRDDIFRATYDGADDDARAALGSP